MLYSVQRRCSVL